MTAWYRLSALAFVGGSLVDVGGHTPYEPALEGCAIAHGPHVSNQADAYRTLTQADAAFPVSDADTLARAFASLGNPNDIATRADRAQHALFDGSAGRVAEEVVSKLTEVLKRFA